MSEKENATNNEGSLSEAFGQIILASGDYYILNGPVSDTVVNALQSISANVASKFRSRLGSVDVLTIRHLISSLSDCHIQIHRIHNYLSTRSLVNSTETAKVIQSSEAYQLKNFLAICKELNISFEAEFELPPCLQSGQLMRTQRIDGFVTHKSTTEQYVEFSRLRSKATLFGRPFDIWLERGGFSFTQKSEGARILAYLVTLCLRDVVDCALFHRQRFGIDVFSQITGIELQQASSALGRLKGYL